MRWDRYSQWLIHEPSEHKPFSTTIKCGSLSLGDKCAADMRAINCERLQSPLFSTSFLCPQKRKSIVAQSEFVNRRGALHLRGARASRLISLGVDRICTSDKKTAVKMMRPRGRVPTLCVLPLPCARGHFFSTNCNMRRAAFPFLPCTHTWIFIGHSCNNKIQHSQLSPLCFFV